MASYKAGDLVWVHIGGGYGWWPCQVMEPQHVAEDRRGDVLRLKRPGFVLVHCHGDKTFNWFDPRDVERISKSFEARSGQKQKSQGVKRFFKLALEEVQELLDARSNKPTVTQHFPVDFTRPETYEHLLREVTSEELDEQQDAAAAMQYPDEATAADAQQASSGAVLLEWLQRAAAMPGAACEELQETPSTEASAAMRLLWSYIHDAAVQQHGSGAWTATKAASGGAKRGRKPAKAAAAAAAAAAAEAGVSAGKQQKQAAGAKRKASASASEAAAAASGKKPKFSSSAAAAAAAAAAASKQQKTSRKQAQETEQDDDAAGSKPSKKRKQSQGSAAAAASGLGSGWAVNAAPLSEDDPQLQDEQLMKYGGPIAGASIRKAAQLLPLAAVAPESIISRLTVGQAKSIALLLRWREAVMARSNCHMKGEAGPLLRGALERAGAMPIRPPLSLQQKGWKQRRSSLPKAGQTSQPQGFDRDEAAAAAGEADLEDDDAAGVGEGAANRGKWRRKQLAGRGRVLQDAAEMSCSGSESDSESGGKASSSSSDEDEGEAAGGRLRKGGSKQQQGREGGSARAAAAAAKQKGRVAELLAVKQAGSLQEKRRAVQQHLQHMGVDEGAAAAAAAGSAGSESDDDSTEAGGAAGGRAAAAAAKAAPAAKVDVAWREYKSRVPASEAAFVADLQRFAGERSLEIKMGKIAGHELTMSDCYSIFKLVADKGGCKCAFEIKAWAGIARAWNAKVMTQGKNVPTNLRTAYEKNLLAYENHVSHGCEVIVKTFKGAQKQKQQQQQQQQPPPTKPARVKQEATPEAKQQQQQVRVKQEPLPVKVKQEQQLQDRAERRRSIDRQRSAEADAAAAATLVPSKQEQQQQEHDQEQQQDDEDAAPEDEGGLTGLEAALAAEAEAAAAGKPPAPAAADAAAAGEAAAVDPSHLRKVSLKFRQQYRLPPMLTVLRAGRRYFIDLDASNVRVFHGKAEVHLIFPTAAQAASAAEGFRSPWARKALRLPEGEPPIEVRVLEIQPPKADWQQRQQQRRAEERASSSSRHGRDRDRDRDSRHNNPRHLHEQHANRDREDYRAGGPDRHDERYDASYSRHHGPQPAHHPPGLPLPAAPHHALAQPPMQLLPGMPQGPPGVAAVGEYGGLPLHMLPAGAVAPTALPGGIVVMPGLPPGAVPVSLPPGVPACTVLPGLGVVQAPGGLPAAAAAPAAGHAPVDPRRQHMQQQQQQQQVTTVPQQQPQQQEQGPNLQLLMQLGQQLQQQQQQQPQQQQPGSMPAALDFTQLDLAMLSQHVASALQSSSQQQQMQQQPMQQQGSQMMMVQPPWHQDQQQQQQQLQQQGGQAPLSSRLEDLLSQLSNKNSMG